MNNRLLELAGINEAMLSKGSIDNTLFNVKVGSNDIKKIKELIKAADIFGLNYMILASGDWKAGGRALYGLKILILNGKTLYSENPTTKKLEKAEPIGSNSKLDFTLVKK